MKKCEGCLYYFRDDWDKEETDPEVQKLPKVCHLYAFGLKCKDGDQYYA